jgi:hypothetical protein
MGRKSDTKPPIEDLRGRHNYRFVLDASSSRFLPVKHRSSNFSGTQRVHPVCSTPKISGLSRMAVMPECRAAWRMCCTIADSICSSTMQVLTSIRHRSMPIRN